MPVPSLDQAWFRLHPTRRYRLRRQTEGELQRLPVPTRPGLTGWVAIRRSDGATELLALSNREAWPDNDECLATLFGDHVEGANTPGDAA